MTTEITYADTSKLDKKIAAEQEKLSKLHDEKKAKRLREAALHCGHCETVSNLGGLTLYVVEEGYTDYSFYDCHQTRVAYYEVKCPNCRTLYMFDDVQRDLFATEQRLRRR